MTGSTGFVSGMLCASYLVAALFFLRFWRDGRDRLFLFFSGAFALLAVHRLVLTVAEVDTPGYVLRLVAFLLILGGIADKNLRP